MNTATVLYLISILTTFIGSAMLVCIPVGWRMHDPVPVVAEFAVCAMTAVVIGLTGIFATRKRHADSEKAGVREGFATVAFGWLAALIFASLPFLFVARMYPADALFETVSGLTTTGASVIAPNLPRWDGTVFPDGVESLPHCVQFWRCLISWLGGMGIVVFALVILPFLGIGATQLYNAEVPGVKMNSDQLTPRIAGTAKLVWGTYVVLTALQTGCLTLGGMPLFDAVCHSFSTVATCGFSTKQASIAAYPSPFIQWTFIVFLFLGACNFTLFFKAVLTRRRLIYFQDAEFRFFLATVVASSLIIATVLRLTYPETIQSMTGAAEPNCWLTSLRYAAFQVSSIISTGGFSTADYLQWPTQALMILFLLTLLGGCTGSTAGGLKCVRVLLLCKHVLSELRRCLFPRAIPDIRLNGERIQAATINKTLAFVVLYLGIIAATAFLLPFLSKMDFITALTASATCVGNVGPGFGAVGPAGSYAWMSAPAKVLLSFAMILGRLEIYTLLVVFMPSFWKR